MQLPVKFEVIEPTQNSYFNNFQQLTPFTDCPLLLNSIGGEKFVLTNMTS